MEGRAAGGSSARQKFDFVIDLSLGRESRGKLVGHDVAELREQLVAGEVFGGRGRGNGGGELEVGDGESAGEAVMDRGNGGTRRGSRLRGRGSEVDEVNFLDLALVVVEAKLFGGEQVQGEAGGGSRRGGGADRSEVSDGGCAQCVAGAGIGDGDGALSPVNGRICALEPGHAEDGIVAGQGDDDERG